MPRRPMPGAGPAPRPGADPLVNAPMQPPSLQSKAGPPDGGSPTKGPTSFSDEEGPDRKGVMPTDPRTRLVAGTAMTVQGIEMLASVRPDAIPPEVMQWISALPGAVQQAVSQMGSNAVPGMGPMQSQAPPTGIGGTGGFPTGAEAPPTPGGGPLM